MTLYTLWLQFEGGDPASSPKGAMSAGQVQRERLRMIAGLTEGSPQAVVSVENGKTTITKLRGVSSRGVESVTAWLWVEETDD